ncbi:DsbA family protein, partial [Patescibacteria group bacterium]|nr:DsbA family protein [Patescibacteria group bacterium]
MKFYSSTFLSIILAFLVFLGVQGGPVEVTDDQGLQYHFSNIIRPVPEVLLDEFGEAIEEKKPEKVTVEVFTTFDCSECDRFAIDTFLPLREKYLEDESVEVKLFVVPDRESEAEYYSAVGIQCAAEQNSYWEMYRALHETPDPLNKREVDLNAQGLGLEIVPFRNCLNSGKYDEMIEADIAYAEGRGATTKPIVFIGGYVLLGNQPIENIEKIIKEALSP